MNTKDTKNHPTTFSLILVEEDLKKIGGTTCRNDSGGTDIICDGKTWYIDEIMIRSIITPLGFKIISVEDFMWENGDCDMKISTTYPWKKYDSIPKLN